MTAAVNTPTFFSSISNFIIQNQLPITTNFPILLTSFFSSSIRPLIFHVELVGSSGSSLGWYFPSTIYITYKMTLSPQQILGYSLPIVCGLPGTDIHPGKVHLVNQIITDLHIKLTHDRLNISAILLLHLSTNWKITINNPCMPVYFCLCEKCSWVRHQSAINTPSCGINMAPHCMSISSVWPRSWITWNHIGWK